MFRTATWISVLVVVLVGCDGEASKPKSEPASAGGATATSATKPAPAAPQPAPAAAPKAAVPAPTASPSVSATPGGAFDPPQPDLTKLQMPMQMRIGSARQAVRSDPESVDKTVSLAALLYAQEFFREAATVFRRAADLGPEDFAPWYLAGRARECAGDLRGAAEMYEKALAVQSAWFDAHPDKQRVPYAPILIRLAGVSFDHDPARATSALQRVLELDPNDPAALAGVGTVALKAARNDEAIAQFRKALDLAPAFGYAHARIAEAYAAKGNAEQAAFHRDQSAGAAPYTPTADPLELVILKRGMQVDVLLREANDFLRRRDYAQAEQMIQQGIDADASGIRGRTMLGLLRSIQGRHEDAVREYRAVLRLDPNSIPTRMALANSLANSNKPDEAEQILREVLAGEPKAVTALDQLARLLASRDRTADAVLLIDQLLEKQGGDARAQTAIAETLVRINRLAEARTLTEKIVKASPNTAEARNVLGFALAQAGDEAGAIREWREATRIAPYLAGPRIQLVQVLHRNKDRVGMAKELREGVAANPYSVDMLNSLAWLLATSPEESQRNAAEAILLAERADALTNSSNHAVLDTLAAAYAEAGRFTDAQARIAAAIAVAREAGLKRETEDYTKRLDLYRNNQPFREP